MKTRRNRNLRYSILLHGGMFRQRLRPAVRRKCRVLWLSDVCLQRDTARRLTARRAAKQILDSQLEVSLLPPYSPRFGTRRFSPPLHLTESVRGRQFGSDEEVNVWLAQQPKDLFCQGI